MTFIVSCELICNILFPLNAQDGDSFEVEFPFCSIDGAALQIRGKGARALVRRSRVWELKIDIR